LGKQDRLTLIKIISFKRIITGFDRDNKVNQFVLQIKIKQSKSFMIRIQLMKMIELTEDTQQSNQANQTVGFNIVIANQKPFHDSGVNIICTGLNESIVSIKTESFFPN
jgi:hypothetical protein